VSPKGADDDGRDEHGGRMIGRCIEPHVRRDSRLAVLGWLAAAESDAKPG
jgi:hypothetical protein